MANPLANLQISTNVIWTPKRAGSAIHFATIDVVRSVAEGEADRVNLVWPDEGDFLKLFGSQDTFKMNESNCTLPPLILTKKHAEQIMRLFSETNQKEELALIVTRSRATFGKLVDAAALYCMELETVKALAPKGALR